MKFNEALDKLDHHYQMIALWENVQRQMQESIDLPEKNIPVNPSVRSTMVDQATIREAQEKVKVQIDYHKRMANQYGDSMLNPKTIPQEGLPSKDEKKPAEKKTDKKKEAKTTEPAKEPETEGAKEATNG